MDACSLLLVDDDRLSLATLASGLRVLGYAATTADSAAAALVLAARQRFDLAVLDMRMPGLGGDALCQLLLQRHGLPSLFLSAYGERGDVHAGIERGGMGYVVKPADARRVMPAIETALARARDLASLHEARAQLEDALDRSRQVSVAVGIQMARHGLSERAAFDALRTAARHARSRLSDHCTELVACAVAGDTTRD